jgi:hypothetical protein
MRIYQVKANVIENGEPVTYTAWCPSGSEASMTRTRFMEKFSVSRKEVIITPKDIPAGKGGFLEWLNDGGWQ